MASVPPHHPESPHPSPTPPPQPNRIFDQNAKQGAAGYQKSGLDADHYVGCLGQTPVSLPEELTTDHRHIMVRGYQPNINERNHRLSSRLREHGRTLSADTPKKPLNEGRLASSLSMQSDYCHSFCGSLWHALVMTSFSVFLPPSLPG